MGTDNARQIPNNKGLRSDRDINKRGKKDGGKASSKMIDVSCETGPQPRDSGKTRNGAFLKDWQASFDDPSPETQNGQLKLWGERAHR